MASYSFKTTGIKQRPERVKPIPSSPAATQPRSRTSSVASSASFTSAVEAQDALSNDTHKGAEPIKFSPEEEQEMVEASHSLKASANKQFASKDYSSAIGTYDKALAELPVYLDYELAVLQSNIAACHLQLKEWSEAIESAERGLDYLERELPMPKPKSKPADKDKTNTKDGAKAEEDDKIIELPEDESEDATAAALAALNISDNRKQDILRIRTKLLLRRARAKVMQCEELPIPKPASYLDLSNPTTSSAPDPAKKKDTVSTWSNLSVALADYNTLSQPEYFTNLPSSDQRTVIEMLRNLPPRVDAAKQKEVDEMMGKLKDLGNGILKPFGLSTDMFKMTQDPNTGGWSFGFDGQAKG